MRQASKRIPTRSHNATGRAKDLLLNLGRSCRSVSRSRTGLFPIMHLIGIKKDLVARHPWLPASVYKAFLSARNFAYKEAREVAALHVTLPWVEAEARETVKLMGKDYWPYGVKESARDIEAMTSYSFAQGLASKKLTPADLFAPGTLEISKI